MRKYDKFTQEELRSRLKAIRTGGGVTQAVAASLLDINIRWYQRIETGERTIRAIHVENLEMKIALGMHEQTGVQQR